MKKVLLLILSMMFLLGSAFSQEELSVETDNETEVAAEVTIRIGILNGPSCVPAAYLIEKPETVEGSKLEFEKYPDPQGLLPKLLKAEVDIGFLPLNVAAKVYNSSNKSIICAGVCGNGNLSVITKDPKIKKITDLEGKTVYVAGQGATPEYIFNYILSQYDIPDVDVSYSIPTANLAANLIADKIEYAVVPEPFATIATSKDNKIFYAVDLQKEYRILTESETYPLTCIVVRSKFAKENPEVLKNFLNSYAAAVDWTIENPAEAGKYCEKNQFGLAAGIVKKSIPKANYVFIPAQESKKQIEEMLTLFMNSDSKAVGGELPDNDFYLK